jgi:hypothetical protein
MGPDCFPQAILLVLLRGWYTLSSTRESLSSCIWSRCTWSFFQPFIRDCEFSFSVNTSFLFYELAWNAVQFLCSLFKPSSPPKMRFLETKRWERTQNNSLEFLFTNEFIVCVSFVLDFFGLRGGRKWDPEADTDVVSTKWRSKRGSPNDDETAVSCEPSSLLVSFWLMIQRCSWTLLSFLSFLVFSPKKSCDFALRVKTANILFIFSLPLESIQLYSERVSKWKRERVWETLWGGWKDSKIIETSLDVISWVLKSRLERKREAR